MTFFLASSRLFLEVFLREVFGLQVLVDRLTVLVSDFLLIFALDVADIASGLSSGLLEVLVDVVSAEEFLFPYLAEIARRCSRAH